MIGEPCSFHSYNYLKFEISVISHLIVDHHILLHKLKFYRITKQLGIWISQFLIGRSQYVQIPGGNSESNVIASSVPQGTVLGPILFLAIIADINQDVIIFICIQFCR